MLKKAVCLIAALSLALLSACAPQVLQEPRKVFKWIASGVETSINPHNASMLENYEIVDLIQVSLYSWAPAETRDRAVLVPALADGEPRSDDGYTWTIELKDGAKWSSGERITADDFIYSWKMGLDPLLAYTSGENIATQYVEVENALAYLTQTDEKPVEWESVGMIAPDERTLVIKTAQKYTAAEVMRHFSVRATSPVYMPLYEAGMNDTRTATSYGTQLSEFLGCGPFRLTHWVKGSERVFEKNEHFFNADRVELDGIECRVVAEEATRLQLFERGDSDYISLGLNGLAKYGEDPAVESYDLRTIRTLEVNQNNPDKPILQDPDFRKALYFAIDRAAAAKLVNASPAPFFLSTTGVSFDDGTLYREMPEANDWLPENNGFNPALAREHMSLALQKAGLESAEITLVYGEDASGARAVSEYLQGQWGDIFGGALSVTLKGMQRQASLSLMLDSVKTPSGEWDLCWSGRSLAAEGFEPHKKFAPYRSTAANRYTNYSNALLDEKYPLLLTEEYRLDRRKTFDLTVEIEKSIILDDMTCIPVYQEKGFVLFSDRVELCVDRYVVSLGFGWEYMDLKP